MQKSLDQCNHNNNNNLKIKITYIFIVICSLKPSVSPCLLHMPATPPPKKNLNILICRTTASFVNFESEGCSVTECICVA